MHAQPIVAGVRPISPETLAEATGDWEAIASRPARHLDADELDAWPRRLVRRILRFDAGRWGVPEYLASAALIVSVVLIAAASVVK